MFDSIRNHQRVLQFILLLLIFPAFAFFGVSGYDQFLAKDDSVASVAGSEITRPEYDDAVRRQVDQLRQTLGEQFDPKMFDTPEIRGEVVEGLIAQRALLLDAQAQRISISDARLRDAIRNIPGLSSPEGGFDLDRYRSLLAAQGLSEVGFEAQMRRDLAVQTMPEAAARSAMVPLDVLDRLITLQEQRFELRVRTFRPAAFAEGADPDEQALRSYYDQNTAAFETPESAKVAYVALSAEAVEAQVRLSPDDVRAYYDQNQARYAVPEQRRASHLLIQVAPGASEDVRKAAREKAQSLLAEARGGAEFAALAREHSEDPGSGAQGGDLGFFAREMMVKPFADAVFALSTEGEYTDVVETEFGFHVIRLTGIRAGSARPFDEVRTEIEAELRRQQASRLFAESAEAFSNLVYEQADTLEPAAERFGLEIKVVENLPRGGTLPATVEEASPWLSNARLRDALFSSESVARKQNTEAIDVGGSTLVSARILEHRPAKRKPFEEVRAEVRARVVAAASRTRAEQAARAQLETLKGGAVPEGFGPPLKASRVERGEVPGAVLEVASRLAGTTLPAYGFVDLGAEGYAVVQLLAVGAPPAERIAERRDAYRAQIVEMVSQQDVADYVASLKRRSKVERHLERLDSAAQTLQ